MGMKEYYLRKVYFQHMGALSQYEYDMLSKKYEFARQTDDGVPVFGTVRALTLELKDLREENAELREKAKNFTKYEKMEEDEYKLQMELKYEQLLSKKILNQAKLSMLMPKKEAIERYRNGLNSLIGLIKNAIKIISPKLINISDQREIEIIITEGWNAAVDDLKERIELVSWDEDGSSDLLRTRLIQIEKEDPELAEYLGLGGSDEEES